MNSDSRKSTPIHTNMHHHIQRGLSHYIYLSHTCELLGKKSFAKDLLWSSILRFLSIHRMRSAPVNTEGIFDMKLFTVFTGTPFSSSCIRSTIASIWKRKPIFLRCEEKNLASKILKAINEAQFLFNFCTFFLSKVFPKKKDFWIKFVKG